MWCSRHTLASRAWIPLQMWGLCLWRQVLGQCRSSRSLAGSVLGFPPLRATPVLLTGEGRRTAAVLWAGGPLPDSQASGSLMPRRHRTELGSRLLPSYSLCPELPLLCETLGPVSRPGLHHLNPGPHHRKQLCLVRTAEPSHVSWVMFAVNLMCFKLKPFVHLLGTIPV